MAMFFLLHHTACLSKRLILQTGHVSSEEHCQWPPCDSRQYLCSTIPGEHPVNLYYIDPSRVRTACSVQSLSHVQLFATPWITARQASLSITNSQSPPKPMSIESVMPSNHHILCRLLLLLPSIFPSIEVFSNESALHIRWPKCWSFSFNISPTNEEHAAAAAKSLQLCPTLCDPRDGSPPGSPVPGILQARTLEWVAISFSNAWKWKVKVKSLSRVRLLATPPTAAHQAPPAMGFARQEYWSGLPLKSMRSI